MWPELFMSPRGRCMHGFQVLRLCRTRLIACCGSSTALSFLALVGRAGTCIAASCGRPRVTALILLTEFGGLAFVGVPVSFMSCTESVRGRAQRAGLSQYQQVVLRVISPSKNNELRSLMPPWPVDIILSTKRDHHAPFFLSVTPSGRTR